MAVFLLDLPFLYLPRIKINNPRVLLSNNISLIIVKYNKVYHYQVKLASPNKIALPSPK